MNKDIPIGQIICQSSPSKVSTVTIEQKRSKEANYVLNAQNFALMKTVAHLPTAGKTSDRGLWFDEYYEAHSRLDDAIRAMRREAEA